jgi:hypothetical protein
MKIHFMARLKIHGTKTNPQVAHQAALLLRLLACACFIAASSVMVINAFRSEALILSR